MVEKTGNDSQNFFDDEEDLGIEYGFDEEEDNEEGAYDSDGNDGSSADIYSGEDGFVKTLNERGRIDLLYWSRISSMSEEEIIDRYEGILIWQDPAIYEIDCDRTVGWLTKEQYVKGNVIKKYEIAERLFIKTGYFEANMDVLKENFPEKVSPKDIHVNLGSTWVPVDIIQDFVAQLLDMKVKPEILYSSKIGKWVVNCPIDPNYHLNYFNYGTLRMNAVKIISHLLNTKAIRIYDPVINKETGKTEYILNENEVIFAEEKAKIINEKWQEYIHGDNLIELRLQEEYMTQFGFAISRFDGSYLKLEDISKDIKLYDHQKNAIAHIISSPNILLAHDVGSGKTYEYACGIHELLRLDIVHKAVVVVPNNTLNSAASAYRELFPEDKVLLVRPRVEFSTKNREGTINKIKGDGYQVIFIAYSSFDMIKMTKKYEFDKRIKEIKRLKIWIDNAENSEMRKKYERQYDKLRDRFEEFQSTYVETATCCFDELGIDLLCVDEVHNYKNISLDNDDHQVVGMHNSGSKKADDMLEKVEFVQSEGGRIIFATGTPITNSLTDLYVLQRYLQANELKTCGIYHLSDWLSTFAEEDYDFEIDVDSQNYRVRSRINKFHNLYELMSMFSEVCDFYQPVSGELGLPDFNGYTNVVVKLNEGQKMYIEDLVRRTEMVRLHMASRKDDNLLLITVHGRMAALDRRLVKMCPKCEEKCPGQICYEMGRTCVLVDDNKEYDICKVKSCADVMADMYRKYPGTTQICFSDIATPKAGFNVYDDLKKELVLRGIPTEEIAYVHDAATEKEREILEKDFNLGKLRILIGSTMKLGTGSNVQEKLIAVHHLDVPWRPADMKQREGRIIRQGNVNDEVFIFRYITEASFDAYTYQLLENKQVFISQFLSGSLSAFHRDETDCADTVLNYAEIKALAIGNPLVKERVETANALEKAKINQKLKRKELSRIQEDLEELPERIAKRRALVEMAVADSEHYKVHKEELSKEDKECLGEDLAYALRDNIGNDKKRLFVEISGFSIMLPRGMEKEREYIIIEREGGGSYMISMDMNRESLCQRRLLSYLNHFPEVVEKHKQKLEELIASEANAKRELEQGNIYDDEVSRLALKLAEIDEELHIFLEDE